MADEFITLVDDDAIVSNAFPPGGAPPWKLLVVDDDPEVHGVTRFVLHDIRIFDRPLRLIFADSGAQARELLRDHPDVAVALLDVVMETEYAGLDLVRHIRDELKLAECRIILRTGQPGYAPELSVIQEYDINDYRTKSELTHTRLITTVSAALRSYDQLRALSEHRRGLELIIRAAADLLEQHAIADLAEGVLTQLAALLRLPPGGIVVTHRGAPPSGDGDGIYVVGASGRHAGHIARPLEHLHDERIVSAIRSAMKRRRHVFNDDYTVLYLRESSSRDAAIFLDSGRALAALDRQLLDVFVSNIAACFRNVKLVERLNYIAYHDPLTGLLNRQGFIADLDAVVSDPGGTVVALMDLHHFTDLNDGLGHDFGDGLLVAVAGRLNTLFEPECRLSRLGGDVFGVIGRGDRVNAASLLELFREPFRVGDYQLPITVSLGLCRHVESSDTGLEILKRANIALNLSKRSSPMSHEYYLPQMEDDIRRRVEIIGDLRRAHHEEKLAVWYQPQVSLSTGEVTGLEALLRWPLNDGFAHPPSVFIPLAEYSGLIFQIGEWVLERACERYRSLSESGFDRIKMAVNVSMPQFQREGFVDDVARCLDRHRMPPGCLELEITESIAMDDPAAVRERLGALRELGVLIAIDDFGTGYSSLGHLQSLPIDFLKIDRAFVIDIGGHGRGLFAGTIVDFCKKLNVLSIAEGVESVEQSDFLRSVGCDIVQGYMYGRPMAPEVLTEWLRSRASGDMAR